VGWGAGIDVAYAYIWSTWNSGVSVSISSLSLLSVCDEGARTYPPLLQLQLQRAIPAILDTDFDWIRLEPSTRLYSPWPVCVLLLLHCVCEREREMAMAAMHEDACMDGLFTVLPAQVLFVSLFGVNAATVSPLLLVLIDLSPPHP